MMAYPLMVAGSERIDTVLMRAWPGRVVAKIGAEGVFSAALPTLGVGLRSRSMTATCAAPGMR